MWDITKKPISWTSSMKWISKIIIHTVDDKKITNQ